MKPYFKVARSTALTVAIWILAVWRFLTWSAAVPGASPIAWIRWIPVSAGLGYILTALTVARECQRTEAARPALERAWKMVSICVFLLLVTLGLLARYTRLAALPALKGQ